MAYDGTMQIDDEHHGSREGTGLSDSGLTAKVPPGRRRIRSFVTRATRMSQGQQKAYDKWADTYCLPFRKETLRLEEVFPEGPLVLEIGFGMGTATAAMADRNREVNYLGIEVHRPGVGKLLSEIERLNLSNIRIINFDAVSVLEEMIPDEVFSGVHIFFPDPWHKKKHHKRRLIQDDFIRLLLPKVKPGGYIYCVTDWEEYGEQMVRVLSGFSGLEPGPEGGSVSPVWRPETKFERKGISKNHSIKEVYFIKKNS